MKDVLRDYKDHGSPLGSSMVVACPVHEPAVLKAVTGGDGVDDATLREVDEAMECPACRLLLALASGDPAYLGQQSGETNVRDVEKVISFPGAPSRAVGMQDSIAASPRRVIVLEDRLAAATDRLYVGAETAGRFQFLLGPPEPIDRRATIEVRVGGRTSIGVRWISGSLVRVKQGGTPLGLSSITVPAQPGRKVRQVLEEALEWAD